MATEAAQLNPWVKRANALGCAVLVVAIAYVVVKTVYLFLDSAAGSAAPSVYGSVPVSSNQSSSALRRIDPSAIALMHLFGEEGKVAPVQAPPKDLSAPKTRLSLMLEGVFVSENEDHSTAMISEARKESQLYHIGDKVPGNATLAAVYADRVLLNLNGQLEALYFPEGPNVGAMVSGSANKPATRVVSARTGRVGPAAKPNNGMMPDPEQTKEIVKMLQDEIAEDPDAVLSQFGLAANDGKGYKLATITNPAFEAMGIRAGDVIVSLNGRALGDPQADIALVPEAMQSACIKVGVERNGRAFNAEICPGQM